MKLNSILKYADEVFQHYKIPVDCDVTTPSFFLVGKFGWKVWLDALTDSLTDNVSFQKLTLPF